MRYPVPPAPPYDVPLPEDDLPETPDDVDDGMVDEWDDGDYDVTDAY